MKTSDPMHYTLLDGAQRAAPLQAMHHGPFAGLAERSAR
jgi:hypothetical protein